MSKKYSKPYPKSYVIAAIVFAVLLCGVWGFYGMLYKKDMQVINHCKMSALANTVAKNTDENNYEPDEALLAVKEINTLATTFELNDVESQCLVKLNEKMKPLETAESKETVDSDALNEAELAAKRLSEAAQENAEIVMATSKKSHITGDYFMMTLFIVVLAAILVIGRFVQKNASALADKEQENRRLETNVANVKVKAYEAAYKNLLYDCGNRFALAENVDKQLKEGKQFCISQFSLLEYCNLISIFGYEQLDECLSGVAGEIMRLFSDSGELYSVGDNGFAFVFNERATLNEITNKSESIRQTINSIVTMQLQNISNTSNMNIQVNAPVIGAIVCTNHWVGKSADSILKRLHAAVYKCDILSPLPVI